METLFWGAVHVTKEVRQRFPHVIYPADTAFGQAIPLLRDLNPPGHGGRILNITSIGGYVANATLAYYCAGKFGTLHLGLSCHPPSR